MALRIAPRLLNLPINELAEQAAMLDPAKPVLTVCNSAYLIGKTPLLIVCRDGALSAARTEANMTDTTATAPSWSTAARDTRRARRTSC